MQSGGEERKGSVIVGLWWHLHAASHWELCQCPCGHGFEIKRSKGKERMVRYHTMRAFFHALSIFSYLFRGPRFVCLGVVLICVHLFTHNLLLFRSTFQPEGRVKRWSNVDVEVERYERRIACLQPLLSPLLSCSFPCFVRKGLFPFCWAIENNN